MTLRSDSDKIKRWREERHWSQEQLSDLAGIGLRTLQRIEKGQPASTETIKALAAAFEVDAIELAFDPAAQASEIARYRDERFGAAFKFSFLVHSAAFACGAVVFIGISLGVGGDDFVMKWPLIWWASALAAHGSTLAIILAAARLKYRQG